MSFHFKPVLLAAIVSQTFPALAADPIPQAYQELNEVKSHWRPQKYKNLVKKKIRRQALDKQWSPMKATWCVTIQASASLKADAQVLTVLPYAVSIKTALPSTWTDWHKQKAGRLKHSKSCSVHTATSMQTATLPNLKISRK